MPTAYSDKGSSIRPYKLTDSDHVGIGRLIRACAEIENIINLRLASLAGVPEGVVLVFLGRMSVTKRLQILKFLSEGRGIEAEELHAQAFDNPNFRELQEMRNVVAHGSLLGMTEASEIAFSVAEAQGIDGNKVYMTVHAYSPGAFAELADIAENIIPQMESAFGLTASRQKHRAPTLSPHSMAAPPEQRGSALSRQRRASQERDRELKKAKKDAQRNDPKNRKKGEPQN